MTLAAPHLRRIAHESLSLTEAAYLRHFKNGRFRAWNGVAFTGSALPGPGFNFAACIDPTPPLDDIIPVAREFFGADQGWGVLVEGDAGHPVEAELRARGWKIDEDEPAFVMDPLTPPPLAGEGNSLHVRIATTESDDSAFHRVTASAFGMTLDGYVQFQPVIPYLSNPDIALFIGEVDGVDAAVVGYSRAANTAVVWGTATLEEYRGRGYGAAVIRAALAHAAERGCTSASLRSGPKSVPLYERLGFRYVCQHRTYAAPPA